MAELTFNSPIRRDKWPRWMIKLHEYLKRIYVSPIQEVGFDDYDRLKQIIIGKILSLRKDKLITTSTFVYIVDNGDGMRVVVLRNNIIVITYYLE